MTRGAKRYAVLRDTSAFLFASTNAAIPSVKTSNILDDLLAEYFRLYAEQPSPADAYELIYEQAELPVYAVARAGRGGQRSRPIGYTACGDAAESVLW